MLSFLQVLKAIKWQDLVEKGENGPNEFLIGTKIHFSAKRYFGARCTLNVHLTNKPRLDHIEQYWNPTPPPDSFCVYFEMLDPCHEWCFEFAAPVIKMMLKDVKRSCTKYNQGKSLFLTRESDWSSAALIWALIGQLYTSCLSNWTVHVIKHALVALEWVIFFSI